MEHFVAASRELPAGIERLVDESLEEGFDFLRRLVDDWRSGANRFAAPKENFWCARAEERLVGVCGVNVDPYSQDPMAGRLRHFYIAKDYRRKGYGRALLEMALIHCADKFHTLVLRTHNEQAAAFYESCGFQRIREKTSSTHTMRLATSRRPS
jgi:ribosomal protein S18 acetylase RimI-like enzyme